MSLPGHLYNLMAENETIIELVNTRVFPLYVPEGEEVDEDCVIYTIISSVPDHVMSGPSGLVESRVQIDCWAKTYTNAVSLGEAVRLLLDGYIGSREGTPVVSSRLMNSADSKELSESSDELAMYRRMLEFEIWYKEYEL